MKASCAMRKRVGKRESARQQGGRPDSGSTKAGPAEFLAEEKRRRAATLVCRDRREADFNSRGANRDQPDVQNREIDGGARQRGGRFGAGGEVPREIRTLSRRSKRRPGSGIHRASRHLPVHDAMMRAVPPAACGQARLIVAPQQRRHRPQREKQNQQNGEPAPHLAFMLHDRRAARNENMRVRYHRFVGIMPKLSEEML